MMPGFFRQMPRPKAGRYTATAYREYSVRGVRVMHEREFNGRLRAYLWARFAALWVDVNTPYWDGEVGVGWRVTGNP